MEGGDEGHGTMTERGIEKKGAQGGDHDNVTGGSRRVEIGITEAQTANPEAAGVPI